MTEELIFDLMIDLAEGRSSHPGFTPGEWEGDDDETDYHYITHRLEVGGRCSLVRASGPFIVVGWSHHTLSYCSGSS